MGGGRYHWSLPVIKCQCLLPLNPPALWGLCLHGLAGGAQCESSPPRKESPLPSHLSPLLHQLDDVWKCDIFSTYFHQFIKYD